MSNFRRSWSKIGERAVMPQQQGFDNHYLYSAVAPLSGESFHLMDIDGMDTISTRLFLCAIKKEYPDHHIVVVWDNAGCHRATEFRDIPGLSIVNLPPYSPELNPAERWFEEMRRETCNVVFETLEKLEGVMTEAIKRWADDLPRMKQLLGYGWIQEQCEGVGRG